MATLPKMMKNGKIQSINSPKEWMRKMSRNGHCGDGVFLQLASACLKRCILVLHAVGQHIVAFGEEEFLNEPLYLLYFEGNSTYSPHFQSIRPLAEKFYGPTSAKSY